MQQRGSRARVWICRKGESGLGTASVQYRPNWTVIISGGGGGGGGPALAHHTEAGWLAGAADQATPGQARSGSQLFLFLFDLFRDAAHIASLTDPQVCQGKAWVSTGRPFPA